MTIFYLLILLSVVLILSSVILTLYLNLKTWTVEHNNDTITVRNKISMAELYINGKLADAQKGSSGCSLISKLPSGESIRVSVNSYYAAVHCNIYVDDVKIFETK